MVIDADDPMLFLRNVPEHSGIVDTKAIALSEGRGSGNKITGTQVIVAENILIHILRGTELISAGMIQKLRFQTPKGFIGGFQHRGSNVKILEIGEQRGRRIITVF